MKSQTKNGTSKIVDLCPAGITTTAIAADSLIIVTENGAFHPMGLNIALKDKLPKGFSAYDTVF